MSDKSSNSSADSGEQTDEIRWYEFSGWKWAFSYIIVWLMPTLLAFGFVLNSLCFITILRNRKTFPKISRQNMLIITACDVIVIAIAGTYYYSSYLQRTFGITSMVTYMDHQHSSKAACHFINYFKMYLMNGTPFFNVGLTTERVIAVVLPLKVKRIMTLRNHFIMLASLFVLGSIAPALWAAEQEITDGRCSSLTDLELLTTIDTIQYNVDFYFSKLSLFIYLLAGCVIVAVSLKLQHRKVAKLSSSDDMAKRQKTVGTCFIMIFMNLVFFLSHGPRAGMSLYEGYCNIWFGCSILPDAELDLIYNVMYPLTFLHNVINPFGYFVGHGFRQAFKENLVWMAKLFTFRLSFEWSRNKER